MALSFSERRSLQKTVMTNLAALAAGKVTFSDRRRLQKEVIEAMAKLNATAPAVVTETGKQPWELTYSVIKDALDFIDLAGRDKAASLIAALYPENADETSPRLDFTSLSRRHKDSIRQALADGKTVPPEVLAEYAEFSQVNLPPINQNLADLQSGKFDSLDPLAFLGKLKSIADAINDIEPLKGPAIAYIEKNSDKVNSIMESAMHEAFGKLWSAGAGA